MSKPNVILIMADDMGYGDLGCVNGGINTTPNLDQLYQESTRLTQGYAASCVLCPIAGRVPDRTLPHSNRYHPIAGCNAAMRDGDWKLVIPAKDGHRRMIQADIDIVQGRRPLEIAPPVTMDLGEGGGPVLFNIADDPGEQEDLADQYRHRTNEMSTELDNWFNQVCGELDVILDRRFQAK